MSMQVSCLIPARGGSSRFPNKPLAIVAGRSLLERVWRICASALGKESVVIATDERAILRHAESFDARAILTTDKPTNGTERVLEAAELLGFGDSHLLINVQGDAVLTPPWTIIQLRDALVADEAIGFATLCTELDDKTENHLRRVKARSDSSGTLVVVNRYWDAMYFSKTLIPFHRAHCNGQPPLRRHVGMYGYRLAVLRQLCALMPGPYEMAEGLEQLRALEHGIPVRVIPADYRGRTHASIDSPSDVAFVEELIRQEGELVE